MHKKISCYIAVLIMIFCGIKANAERDFLLPKSFNYNIQDKLPPNVNGQTQTISTESDKMTPHKENSTTFSTGETPISTNKPNTTTTSTNNDLTKTNFQSQSVKTHQTTDLNNIQTYTVQTNPVKNTVKAKPVKNNVSLANLVKNYRNSYADTLKSTIVSLNTAGVQIVSYNTDKGQIIGKLPSGKEIFILVVPFSNNQTSIRITPTDGNYDIPMEVIQEIFSSVENNLQSI